jgi:hypothetical protein
MDYTDHLFCHPGMMTTDLEDMIVVGRHTDSLFLRSWESSNPGTDSHLLSSDTVEETQNEEEPAVPTSFLNSPPCQRFHTNQDVNHVVLTVHTDYKATSVDHSVRNQPWSRRTITDGNN